MTAMPFRAGTLAETRTQVDLRCEHCGHELTIEKIQAEQGWITVPDRPGLGVTLNEDFVKSTLIAESR